MSNLLEIATPASIKGGIKEIGNTCTIAKARCISAADRINNRRMRYHPEGRALIGIHSSDAFLSEPLGRISGSRYREPKH